MTPDQIALSRAAMALPGAPAVTIRGPLTRYVGGPLTYRGADGILWLDCADGSGPDYDWVLDFRDPATGGVLVAMLGVDAGRISAVVSTHKRGEGLRWWANLTVEDGRDDRLPVATLAEASCNVAIVVGGWRGGV